MSNSLRFARILLLISAFALAACDGENFLIKNPDTSGTGGGGSGDGGSGGGSGGGNEPLVVYGTTAPNDGYGKVIMAGDGSKIVFTNNSDPLGTNPGDEWQLWSHNLNTGVLLQLTTGEDNPIASGSFTDVDASDNASHVVWISLNDFTGQNPNNRSSVFMAATDGSGITQVTINIEAFLLEPIISGDASTVAFLSDEDLTGDNPGLDRQIFKIDANGDNLTQVTSLPSSIVRDITFSDDGSTIAWVGSGDPFGTNADNSLEIFSINIDGTNYTQLTASDADAFSPKLSDDGSVLVFSSTGDHSPGANSDGSDEIFAARTDGSGIIQIANHDASTGTPSLSDAQSYNVSGDGNTVVFTSRSDLVGQNPGLESTLYWTDTTGGAPVQLLRSGTIADANERPIGRGADLSNDGSDMAFYSPRIFTTVQPAGFEWLYSMPRQ